MRIKTLMIGDKVCGKVALADSFILRLRGLLGRQFDDFDALHITPCSDIHMLFMAFPIDVLFVDRSGIVVKIAEHLKPWALYAGSKAAYSVLEIPDGKAGEWGAKVGDIINIQ